jgi:hypothetical protein
VKETLRKDPASDIFEIKINNINAIIQDHRPDREEIMGNQTLRTIEPNGTARDQNNINQRQGICRYIRCTNQVTTK